MKSDLKAFRIRQILANFWSLEEKRQAHNLKVAGSNPAPATSSELDKKELLLLST